jgi:hypothetical protein
VTGVYVVAHNVYWSAVWNMLRVTHLVQRILTWLLDIWKICGPS